MVGRIALLVFFGWLLLSALHSSSSDTDCSPALDPSGKPVHACGGAPAVVPSEQK